MAALNACIVHIHRRGDPMIAHSHPVFSRELMQLFRRSQGKHATPEAWLAELKSSKQAPPVPVYKTFVIQVFTRPNSGGRALIPVDPNLPDPIAGVAYHIVKASGTGTRKVSLKLNNEPLTKKSQLEELRKSPPYALKVTHGTTGREAITVPTEEPSIPSPVAPAASTSSAVPAAKTVRLADTFTVRDGNLDKTAVTLLTRNIAENFGQRMHKRAKKANLPRNGLLNGRHVAHATAHKTVMDPEVYRRTLIECGMSEPDAAKVTPDQFWDELAQLSAAEAADTIGKSIADSVASMPNSAVNSNPERLYATKAAGAGIFRDMGERLRYLLTGYRPGPYWAYRMSPSYSLYHYEPEVVVPAPVGVYPTLPLPYGHPRRHERGRRWLMMKPFRMAVANVDEADAQIAAAAHIESMQGERQAMLASHLAAEARAADAGVDVEIKAAAGTVDVITSLMVSASDNASSMPGLIKVSPAASALTSMPGLEVPANSAQSSMPSLVPLPTPTPAAARVDIGAVNFSVPSMIESPAAVLPAASPMCSLMAPDTLATKLPKFDPTLISPLSTELMVAAGSDLAESCAIILPEIPRNSMYRTITAKLASKSGEARVNAAKSIADHYTIPGTGHADQLTAFLAGESSSVQLNSRAVGNFWRLSRTPGGSMQLKNSKGTVAYAGAYQHDEHPHVMVFTVPMHHNM